MSSCAPYECVGASEWRRGASAAHGISGANGYGTRAPGVSDGVSISRRSIKASGTDHVSPILLE